MNHFLSYFKKLKFFFLVQEEKGALVSFLYYGVIASFVVTFNQWFELGYLTKNSVEAFDAVCPPYFQSCLSLYVFTLPPLGYSLGMLYAGLGAFIFGSVYFVLIKRWRLAMLLLVIPLVFKILMLYMFTFLATGNYTVIEILATIAIIFSKRIFFSIKIIVSLLYLFSALIKIYPSYLQGRLFDTLSLGLPFLPKELHQMTAVFVVVFFMVCAIVMWSKDTVLRNIVFVSLFAFHIYTITLVGFRFPFICMILLFITYFSSYETFSFKKLFEEKILTLCIVFLICAQITPLFIQGNSHITGEGERYGFYIFNTNKQCVASTTVMYLDGKQEVFSDQNTSAIQRCDPYLSWFTLKQYCQKKNVESISHEYFVSLNGSAYFKVVDTDNICTSGEYKAFSHNDWIKEGDASQHIKVYKNHILPYKEQ